MEQANQVIQVVPQEWYMFLGMALFAIGVTGVLLHRNTIILLMCIELMMNAVNLLLVAFSAYKGAADGQVFVFFIMVVAAAEVTVGLAIIVMIYRNLHSVNINLLNKLKW